MAGIALRQYHREQDEPGEDDTAQRFTDWMRNGEEVLLLELENNYPL